MKQHYQCLISSIMGGAGLRLYKLLTGLASCLYLPLVGQLCRRVGQVMIRVGSKPRSFNLRTGKASSANIHSAGRYFYRFFLEGGHMPSEAFQARNSNSGARNPCARCVRTHPQPAQDERGKLLRRVLPHRWQEVCMRVRGCSYSAASPSLLRDAYPSATHHRVTPS